ncbi:hypothetical protein [Microtetraspora malaysiensis]|uniref:hypothetical protein n=1 Tax=Microtetraspora malaysiensis TaxID=161358 RepID=UPI003D8D7226
MSIYGKKLSILRTKPPRTEGFSVEAGHAGERREPAGEPIEETTSRFMRFAAIDRRVGRKFTLEQSFTSPVQSDLSRLLAKRGGAIGKADIHTLGITGTYADVPASYRTVIPHGYRIRP